jgi:hypothetical protein
MTNSEQTKVCTTCKVEKVITEFHKEKNGKYGVKSKCKECFYEYKRNNPKEKEYRRTNYVRHKGKKLAYKKQYKKDNAERIKEYNKEYNARPEVKKAKTKYNREYERNRRANDPLYDFKKTIKSTISRAITSRGYAKNSQPYLILGAEYKFVKGYIQRQFKDGMNWNNYGKWEIDHIRPMASAKNEEQTIELNHYTNLQPLWKNENREKNNKIINKQLRFL